MAPITAGLKLVALTALYSAANAAFAFWFSQAASSHGVRAVLGVRYSFALFLTPNVLSFGITAWLLRPHWARLRLSQILVATFFAAALTIAITMVCAFVFGPFVERSTLVSKLGARITMVLPGILAAQLLRFGTRSQANAPAA
jgi:hypothetical protein